VSGKKILLKKPFGRGSFVGGTSLVEGSLYWRDVFVGGRSLVEGSLYWRDVFGRGSFVGGRSFVDWEEIEIFGPVLEKKMDGRRNVIVYT
jgi:hypothetical protein